MNSVLSLYGLPGDKCGMEDGHQGISQHQQAPKHRLYNRGEKYLVTKLLCVNIQVLFQSWCVENNHISHPCIPPPGYQHHCVDMTARCMKYEYNFYSFSPPPLSSFPTDIFRMFSTCQSCDVSRDKLSRLRSGRDTM